MRFPSPKLPRPAGLPDRVRSALRRVRYAISDAAYWLGSRLRNVGRRLSDGLIPDRVAARIGRLAASVRGLGARLGAVARGLREKGRVLGRRARGAWTALSLRTRRLIGAALALVLAAALVWFAAVPNLPCQFPAGDRCPPADDAAELVPADALAYLHANLDPATEQAEAASELTGRLPLLSAQLLSLVPLPGGEGVDFASDVEPWLAGEVALAFIAGEGGAPEQVYLLEVADTEGAERFARGLTGTNVSKGERGGVEVQVGERGVATAVTDGFLFVGTEIAVQRLIDTQAEDARSLADSEVAEAVADGLPDDSLAQAYVSGDGVQRLLSANSGPLSTLEIFVNFEATVGAGAALVASAGGIELEIHSELDPERLRSSPGFFDAFPPFEPTIPERLPPRSLAYLGLGDPEASIERLLDQAQAGAPGLVVGYEDFAERLQKAGKVNLEDEVLPVLAGEAAFVIQPPAPATGAAAGSESDASDEGRPGSEEQEGAIPELPGLEGSAPGAPPAEDVAPEPPGTVEPEGVVSTSGIPNLTFIGTEVDSEAATEALAKLQAPLAQALVSGESVQTPTFEQGEVEGIPVFSVSISPAVDLTYAVFDGDLVVSTQPAGVARLATGPGGLDEAPPFERATAGFPDQPALLLYLNLRELILLAERAGLASDPAYALFSAEIAQVPAAALAVERGEAQLDTLLRVSLEQPAE